MEAGQGDQRSVQIAIATERPRHSLPAALRPAALLTVEISGDELFTQSSNYGDMHMVRWDASYRLSSGIGRGVTWPG